MTFSPGEITLFIYTGFLLIFFVFAFVLLERRLAPPAGLFLAGYISACYIYPVSIFSLGVSFGDFNYANFESAWFLATTSLLGVLVGYVLFFGFVPYRPPAQTLDIALKPGRIKLLYILLYMCLAIIVSRNPIIFGSDYVHGTSAYSDIGSTSLLDRLGFIAANIVDPLLVLSLLVIQSLDRSARRIYYRYLLVALFVIVLNTAMQFDRQAGIFAIIHIGLAYHYRVRSLRLRHLVLALLAFLSLQIIRDLRYMDASVDLISFLSNIEFTAKLVSIGSSIAGWDVVTNVLSIVPDQETFQYGGSYLRSVIGLFQPRVLGVSFIDIETPSLWYKNVYAPLVQGHGYDFAMLAEAYWNFGFYAPLFFIFIGGVVGWLSRIIRSSSNPFFIVFAIVSLVALTFGLRMDSNAVIKSIVFKSLVPIVIVYFANRLTWRPR